MADEGERGAPPAAAAKRDWLPLVPRLPPGPARLRPAGWRRLKSLGAICLQDPAATRPAGLGVAAVSAAGPPQHSHR